MEGAGEWEPTVQSGPGEVSPWVYAYRGGRWSVATAPAADKSAQPAVLLVHGQPGSGHLWGALPDHLSRFGGVYSYDRPGWGANRSDPGDLILNAECLCSVAEGLGGPVVVVGYSYGAAVALEALSLGCAAIAALVLVAPAANALAIGPLDRAFEPPWIARVTGRAAVLAAVGRLPARASRILFAAHSLAVESGTLREDLSRLRASPVAGVPIAVVAGLADRTVPPSSVSLLASATGAEPVRWSDTSGHLLPLRRPRLVAQAVASVIRGIAR
ncbi:MAG: alpha/beta hydrolase [Actinomycetota bacterium]|nr:alpha/beta hydrolase [Actinomycetota bacterium]